MPEDLLPWLLLPPTALALSLVITAQTRRYALRRALVDHPNERSSHSEATPRGGGLGLVIAILVCTALLGITGSIAPGLAWAVTIGGGAVALIGWIDDHGHVHARWRALVHALAAAFALYMLGGFPTIDLGPTQLTLGLAGSALALVAIVWLTNLYNFMDGIDGIAGSQAVLTAGAAALLLWLNGAAGTAILCLVIAAASLGFLYWNWPKARIFMGDIGSGFLGFCFGVLAIHTGNQGELPSLLWVLLLALFIADASYTLVARVLRGERWYEAHREHAYQRLTQRGWSHRWVTVSYLLLNLLVLLPAALWAWSQATLIAAFTLATYVLLWFGWRWGRQRD